MDDAGEFADVGVMKFGGSTFMEVKDYLSLAATLRTWSAEQQRKLVIVVSAMRGETERLRETLTSLWPLHTAEASQSLLPMADSISAHLLHAALRQVGACAAWLDGWEAGFVAAVPSSAGHLNAVSPAPLERALDSADIVVLAGGQATDEDGRHAWLGKNSSDVSAVAAAVAVGARECDIFSDVDGIYRVDPRLAPDSDPLPTLSYPTAAAMGRFGAKVLHPAAVELAERHRIRIRCRENRRPYRSGSSIGPDAPDRSAVVFNDRSHVLRFESRTIAADVIRELTEVGIRAMPYGADDPRVVIVGEYQDVTAILRRRKLPAGEAAGFPVVEVYGERVHIEVLHSRDEAIRHVAGVHRGVPGPRVPERTTHQEPGRISP
ncbi:aspartate kinase [Streptomyces anulatus]|uniref:amino acid kinase family protein n=1 Tax=Streptomyces anulatus TaxID=1892 RepID=UPI0034387B4C